MSKRLTLTIPVLAACVLAAFAVGARPAQADWGNLILVPASWPDDYEIGNDGFYYPDRIWPWEIDWDDAEVVISPCLGKDVCGDDGSEELVIGGSTVVLVPRADYLANYGPVDTVLVGYRYDESNGGGGAGQTVADFCAANVDEWNYDYCLSDPWPYGWTG